MAAVGNRSLIASLVTLAVGLAPAVGYTAGLGRLTITSGIGQPLVGEIELVSVRKEEMSSLGARVASPEAYSSANLTYNPALVGARATIERRADGQPYIRITSLRPVDEPFIDVVVELTWNTGRLVREYSALLDPPRVAPAQPTVAAAPAPAAPETKPVPARAPAAPAARPATGSVAAEGDGQKTYGPVQPGDTLRKIAAGVKPQEVSLEQALVGIFRSNPSAFINNNMNLLRTGQILRIPDAADLTKVAANDAAQEVRVQAGDWNAYRQRTAAAAPEVPAGESRAAAGKITTTVDDPAAAGAASKEVVKVSKGAPGKDAPTTDKALQDRIRVLEEEATAREKTLKESNERIGSLEKTIKDMQRLLELKGGAAPPPVKPAEPVEATKPTEVKPDAPPVAEKSAPSVAKPEPTAPVAKPPATEAKKAPTPAASPAWYEDPTLLGGALAALGVVGGGIYLLSRRRRDQDGATPGLEPAFRPPSGAPLGRPTEAVTAAAAAVAAAPAAATTAEMPAAQPAAASDEVDPIAEADVYIAYGRDAQAEEILKDALKKDPSREAIKLKLLEIYAARKSKNEFTSLATDLHESTRGRGDTWLKAAAMGYALDPDNALYAAGKDSAILPPAGVSTDVNLDFDLDMVSAAGAPTTMTDVPLDAGRDAVTTTILSPDRMQALRAEGAADAVAKKPTDTQSIIPDASANPLIAPQTDVTLEPATARGPATDFNLDVATGKPAESNVIDFEFDPSKTVKIEPEAAAAFGHDQTVIISPEHQQQARDLGVEIDLSALDSMSTSVPKVTPAEPATDQTAEMTFDFKLPSESSAPPTEAFAPPTDISLDLPDLKPAQTSNVDFALDTVSLDLGSAKRDTPPAAPVHDDHWYDVQTKFDLAKAYQEMGDKDGAREILAEVIKEGDSQQQAEANELLAKLG